MSVKVAKVSWDQIIEGIKNYFRIWFAMLSGSRNIEFVGWIRTPLEEYRDLLRLYGVSGEMRWEQETPEFGVLSHCSISRKELLHLWSAYYHRSLDIYIGGFTGVWKGTDIQVPRGLQDFWNSLYIPEPNRFWAKHGYSWDHNGEGKWVPIVKDELG